MTKIFDITIIGGSFAGMSAALAMAQISPDIKIAVIEKIIEIYDDLVINSIERHVSRSELIDFSKIDKFLNGLSVIL